MSLWKTFYDAMKSLSHNKGQRYSETLNVFFILPALIDVSQGISFIVMLHGWMFGILTYWSKEH